MRAIDIRELKERTSQVLRHVRQRGEEISIRNTSTSFGVINAPAGSRTINLRGTLSF